jgi:hypothetical protein
MVAHRRKHRPSHSLTGLGLAAFLSIPRMAVGHEVSPPVPQSLSGPEWPNGRVYPHDVVVPVVLTVSAEGTVLEVELEASVNPDFDAAAVKVAHTWLYHPARFEGKAVATKIRALVRFVGDPTQVEEKPRRGEDVADNTRLERLPSAQPARPNTTPKTEPSPIEVEATGERVAPPRSASETTRSNDVISAAPHRTGGDLLQIIPGVFITQHSGQGKAYQVFYRGFDAVHGQDLEFWVGGAPVNEVSNIHGQGYADLHFVMPEVVSRITVLPGNFSPEQGDFAVAGTVRYDLGYQEPGITVKGGTGSFGERRVFLAYRGKNADPGSFAAFEAQSTDGFGKARAAQRTSAIAQQVFKVGKSRLRLLATGYAAAYDSPGVVSLRDIESGTMGRFDTYGTTQGGFSSRYQLVADLTERNDTSDWAISPYFVLRGLNLKQNYTGYLLNENDGDASQLTNHSTTLGVTGHYRRSVRWLSRSDSIEAGVFVRNDWIEQSQLDVANGNGKILGTVVDANILAMNAAGWVDLAVSPFPRIKVRTGLRIDGLAYNVQDNTPAKNTREGSAPDTTTLQLRPSSPGGQARTSMGTHYGPRVTIDGTILPGLHALLSYGEGFRSPQARSLGDGEKTPFTTVQSVEAGVRYTSAQVTGSIAAFYTTLNNDLVFSAATTRNERVPGSQRIGGAVEYVIKPAPWFTTSGSGTFTQATFTESDRQYAAGDKLPYVPQWIFRQDTALLPQFGRIGSRHLTGRFGASLTGMFNRPQPFGALGHNVFLLDAVAELRLKEVALGVDVFNLLDAKWYDSEFTYSAHWNTNGAARLVPERYVTVGSPRTVLATLSWFIH